MSTISFRLRTTLAAASVLLLLLLLPSSQAQAPSKVPALFVFGDSSVDTGNNNFLASIAKANYFPYGIDSPRGISSRFTNERNIADMIGALLGMPAPPPFADRATTGNRILGGVNYASAAAGILDDTGRHYGRRFSLSQQVINFETTLSQLRTMMNRTALDQYLAKSIAILVFGSNDYIHNYLMPPFYTSSFRYRPVDYANLLLNRYTQQILALHSVGLRKFFISGIGPLGCIPTQRAAGRGPAGRGPAGRCVDSVNQMLGTFNEGLHSLVDQLNSNHPGSIFVYGNTYGVVGDMLNEPSKYGIDVVDRSCCMITRNIATVTCIPLIVPCPNRNQFLYWDGYHLTSTATAVLAQRAFSGTPSDSYPINVQQMSLLF